MRFAVPHATSIAFAGALSVVLVASPAVRAGQDLIEEEFRLYCGYLDSLEQPAVQKIKGQKAKDKKIAQLAKVKPPLLLAAVEKGRMIGATCDEVGKKIEVDAKAAAEAALPGRIVVFNFDYTDPAHVVAQATWLGVDKKKLVEEASVLAAALATEAKIIKTIAIRGVDPAAADKTADTAVWFEAKITRANAQRIDKAKVADYAETRYLRLFDGVVRK
jgi:hypothetical protein